MVPRLQAATSRSSSLIKSDRTGLAHPLKRLRANLPAQVVIAMVAGIGCGLFFGESCAVFAPVGQAFIMLLEMVVLPYIPCALIEGFGALSAQDAVGVFRRGWLFIVGLWCLTLLVVFCVAALFPAPLPGPASSGLVAGKFEQSFLELLIPQNPVSAMSKNMVSAVAVFGVFLGTALMNVPGKKSVLDFFGSVNQALLTILRWISLISPIGIFALLASSMGTIRFQAIAQISLYLIAYVLAALILTFLLLNGVFGGLTGFASMDLFRQLRAAMLLGFTTGLPSVTLPLIEESVQNFARKRDIPVDESFRRTLHTLLPLAYSIAQIGNLLVIVYVLFAAFYFRHPLSSMTTALLVTLSVPMSFGGPTINVNAVSFIQKQIGLPASAMTVFIEMMPLTRCFQVMLSVVGMTVIVTLLILQKHGLLTVQPRALFKRTAPMLLLMACVVALGKTVVRVPDSYNRLYADRSLREVSPYLPRPTVDLDTPHGKGRTTPLVAMRPGGVLRIGYYAEVPPFAYLNGSGELVGYDVAFGCQLAYELQCRAEFVPFRRFTRLKEHFRTGDFDICMSAVVVTLNRFRSEEFSSPVMEQPLSLIVPTDAVARFSDGAVPRDVTVGGIGAFADPIGRRLFPQAHVVDIQDKGLHALRDGEVSAVLWSRAQAEAWTSLHPGYQAVTAEPPTGTVTFAYALPAGSPESLHLVNYFLQAKKSDGFEKRQYDYWLNGELPDAPPPRWSVWHDVLHMP